MQIVQLGTSPLLSSRLAYGCWRLTGTWNPAEITPDSLQAGRQAVLTAYEAGYTLFDHADIYCDGEAEKLFGQILKDVPGMRQNILIASKCGIRKAGDPDTAAPYRYDFSRRHILWSCEQSLRRLGIETIDLYQLHRPDYLADFEEVAAAFVELKQQGKVRAFGVSNFSPSQLAALQKICPFPLVVNQVEISLARLAPFEDGTLDQCQAQRITPLAWSPLAGGLLGNGAHRLLPAQQAYQPGPVLSVVDELARAHAASRVAIALAWLLRHPAGIVPIIGSTRPDRIREAVRATEIQLSREEWYKLFVAARGQNLP